MQTMPAPVEVTFDAHEYELKPADEEKLREKLESLAKQVEQFPMAELRVRIHGVRSNQVVVKLTLLLPGDTLSVEDYDLILEPAFDRCLNSLLNELQAFKERLSRSGDGAVHPDFDMKPGVLIDIADLERAAHDGDYVAFHRTLSPIEDELRLRVGRWVQRYPEIDAAIGERLEIADIVEEVLLMAFDGFANRPENVPLGTWLEKLIDPAIRSLVQHPDEERVNIAAVRSARGAAEGQSPP